MKYSIRILTAILCVFLLLPCLVLGVGAQTAGGETSHRAQVIADMTTGLWDVYRQKVSDSAPDAGTQTAAVIRSYIDQLYDLEDTAKDSAVDLIYEKGRTVAPLSWIYFSHPELHPAEGESNEILETYLAQKAIIDGKTTSADRLSEDTALASFFNGTATESPEVYDCYTELLRTIYTEKLDRIKEAESSTAVHRILTLSGATVLKLTYTNEDGTNFKEEYAYACNIVQKRKNWEATNADVAALFALLYPSHSFETDPLLTNYFNSMEVLTPAYERTEGDATPPSTTTVTEYNQSINQLLESTALTLLNGLKTESADSFRNTYLSAQAITVENATIRADAAGTRLELLPLFRTYSYDWTKATAKDEIADYAANQIKEHENTYLGKDTAALNRIAAEYTANGGILDGYSYESDGELTDLDAYKNAIAAEVTRAKKRADWFDAHFDAVAAIKGYLAGDTALTERAAAQYAATDEAIANGERDGANALADDQAVLDDLVAKAEALAFTTKYRALLDKPADGVTAAADKATLLAAIDDATRLSPAAAAKLVDELTDLGNKYKTVAKEEVASLLSGTDSAAIRADSINSLRALIDALLTTETADKLASLPTLTDALLEKAADVDTVLDHFRDNITADSKYTSYDDTYKTQMQTLCATAASGIIEETATAEDAVTALNRLEALAKLHAAAKGAESIDGVANTLTKAESDLPALTDGNAIEQYTALGVRQIEAYRTADEAYRNTLNAIDALPYPSETQKVAWKAEAKAKYDDFLTAMETADTPAKVDAADSGLTDGLTRLQNEAAATDLSIAKELAKQELADQTNAAKETIGGYEFIDETSKDTILGEIDRNQTDGETAIDGCTDTAQVTQKKNDALSALEAQKELAAEEERKDCLDSVTDTLDNCYTKDDYSAQKQVEIHDILKEYESALQNASTVEQYVTLRDEALAKIGAIPNLLQEAQADSVARLTAAYESLLLRASLYSSDNLLSLREIYEHSVAEIGQFNAIADAQAVLALADERIALMRAIPLDRIYTEDGLLAKPESVGSPSDTYRPEVDGYVGSVESVGGISSDAKLTVSAANATDVAERIRRAAKKELVRLQDGTSASAELLKLLKNCHVSAALDVDLGTNLLSSASSYTVSVLLPDGIRMSDVIGVVYLCEDGSVEFYEITSEDTLIRFVTTHFSEFYVVSENTVNLISWIVVLSILILCEIIAIVLLYIRRRRRDWEEKVEAPLYSFALPFFALTRYTPENGVLIVVLLGVTAVLLGGWIAALILLERRADLDCEEEDYPEEEPEEFVPVSVPVPALVTEKEQEPTEDVPAEISEEEEPEAQEPEQEEAPVAVGYLDPEQYLGKSRAVINLDTLSAHFEAEDTVTLNDMKAMGLVPKNAGFVKVLGRGDAKKALTVVAQDFSERAWNEILAAGGTPIVTVCSSQRGGKKKPMPYRPINK